jgi:hypothetical protein
MSVARQNVIAIEAGCFALSVSPLFRVLSGTGKELTVRFAKPFGDKVQTMRYHHPYVFSF